ncbi:mechanosensitive ion channel family protein [Pseudobowmanella zhangzhouensis]|uniref:mechanosensitive ion channel family protein n=1 Tax=Pseudobowmanella zhangzhouensis TaxID=1537679 RepID=UPI0036172CD1
MLFKPFKVGDVIEAQGFLGKVTEIQIFNTLMLTLDNQKVVIPNGALSNGNIKNLFSEPTRRIDLTFGVSYSDDIDKVRAVLKDVLAAESRLLADHDQDIFVSAHADSSVNFELRAWVNSDDYVKTRFALIEAVKKPLMQTISAFRFHSGMCIFISTTTKPCAANILAAQVIPACAYVYSIIWVQCTQRRNAGCNFAY